MELRLNEAEIVSDLIELRADDAEVSLQSQELVMTPIGLV